MDTLEKIDRLRERANVTYEEARDALAQSGDDLLDAIVLLEKQGKVKQPGQTTPHSMYGDVTMTCSWCRPGSLRSSSLCGKWRCRPR